MAADLPAVGNSEKIMGRRAESTFHIAVAAANGVDYLLTWNCKHIANPAMRPRIEQICRDREFEPPVICTPQELLEIDDEF